MANKKISILASDTGPALTDVVVTVEDSSGLNKKVTLSDIADLFNQSVVNPYCFRAYNSSAVTLTSSSLTTLTFGTEVYDYNNNFASNTYTAPFDGVYHFDTAMTINGAMASATVLGIFVTVVGGQAAVYRGTRLSPSSTPTDPVVGFSMDILMDAGDTITVSGIQASGGTEATLTGNNNTFFSGHLVHKI